MKLLRIDNILGPMGEQAMIDLVGEQAERARAYFENYADMYVA